MLAGSGTTHTVYLVRPSKYADAGAPPPPKITCTSEARAALQRLAQLYEFSVVDSLPTDLMLHILLELWQSWPLATRALRVSKGLAECATMARGLLPPGEWWTGSGPPLQVPGSAIDEKIDLDTALPPKGVLRLGVTAADAQDVRTSLLRVRAAASARAGLWLCWLARRSRGADRSAQHTYPAPGLPPCHSPL